jgi:ketosteroid isomerase-like protein
MGSDNEALVRRGFEAFLAGDFERLRDLLASDAQWLWWEPIPGDCHEPDKILATLRDRRAEGVFTGLKNVVGGGEKLLVELTGPRLEEWGSPDAKASMVVTVRDGRIVRVQDHPSREAALFDAGLAGRPAPPPLAPPEHTEPGWDTVSGMVPFVHVTDVPVSLAFYEPLGFRVTARQPASTADPSWVSLQAGGARLMLQQADGPVQADARGVLFYMFARDLWGLRERLIAAGIDAGPIHDGRPGPDAQMQLADPGGYVVMVAQTDEHPGEQDAGA